jgi:hypothetical protein
VVTEQNIVLGGIQEQEIRDIAISLRGLAVILKAIKPERLPSGLVVQQVIAKHFVTGINTEVVVMEERMYGELLIPHIAVSQDFPLAMT